MSMIYGLFAAQATTVDGVTTYDRSVGDEFFKELFSAIVQNGVTVNKNGFEVTAGGTSMSVSISPGGAMIEGHFCYDRSEASLTVPAASSARTDLVILRLNTAERTITLELAQNTTELSRGETIYELALARIDIPSGASVISADMITDLRSDPYYCGASGVQVEADAALSVSSTNAIQNCVVAQALADLGSSSKTVTIYDDATYTLIDGAEYRSKSAISSLILLFPTGKFHSWLRFTTADSEQPFIDIPESAVYLGVQPVFGPSETWELSIKDGYVIAAKVS